MHDKKTEIRVAVALVALRFKPIKRSCVSYVLDLRDKFPCPEDDAQSVGERTVGREWKERALELETRCMNLERIFEWDKLERLFERDMEEYATSDQGKKREKKRDKAGNRPMTGLERVLNGKVAGHSLEGLITISARSALTIYERLMRAQDGLLTRPPTDSVAEREQFSRTAIPVTFSVARSGLEELGKMVQVITDVGRNPREICDILRVIDQLLRGMLQSLFVAAQEFTKTTGLRAKQIKQLERLVEAEYDLTFGTLTEVVLLRLVRLVLPWTERMIESSEQIKDTPMELIEVLEGALEAVERSGFDRGSASVKERVGFGVCQELRRLSRRTPVDGGSKSIQERKQRLAKKDTVWYLGAVLQRCFGGGVSGRMADRVVESARFGRLGRVESEFVLGRCAMCWGIAEK